MQPRNQSCGDFEDIGELFSVMAGHTLPPYAICDLLDIPLKDLDIAQDNFVLPHVPKELFGKKCSGYSSKRRP